jgi:hypothetical protein
MLDKAIRGVLEAASAGENGRFGVSLVLVIVILLIAMAILGNAATLAGPLMDIVLLLCFAYLVYASGKYANSEVGGLGRLLPACHDLKEKVVYCARHNGLHIGFLFWFPVFIVLNSHVVPLVCSLNDSIWAGPFLFFLLFGLPLDGIKTKMGGKSTLEFKFWSAFFWALVVLASGTYLHYTFISPC